MDTITPVESHLTLCRLPHFCPTRGRLALSAYELSSNFTHGSMTWHDEQLVLRDLRIRIPSVLSVSGSVPASGGTGVELADGLDSVRGAATRGVPR